MYKCAHCEYQSVQPQNAKSHSSKQHPDLVAKTRKLIEKIEDPAMDAKVLSFLKTSDRKLRLVQKSG